MTQSHAQLPLALLYPSLAALTLAALALPELAVSVASAADKDGVEFQYGRYQQGPRILYAIRNKPGATNCRATICHIPIATLPFYTAT